MISPRVRLSSLLLAAGVALPVGALHAQARYDSLFAALTTTVRQRIFDPALAARIPRLSAAFASRAAAARSDAEFALVAMQMLDSLGVSHLRVVPPPSPGRSDPPGFLADSVGGALVVTDVAPLSDAAVQGLRPGAVLRTPRSALAGPRGTRAEIDVTDCDGRTRHLNLLREHVWYPPRRPSIQWQRIYHGALRVGYIDARSFEDDAAPLADAAMAELGQSDAIIVDVRRNTGGNASALRLASYFAGGRKPAVAILSRQYIDRLGSAPRHVDLAPLPAVTRAYTDTAVFHAIEAYHGAFTLYTEDVGAAAYRRPVFVLMGGETASAAEGFVSVMKLETSAVLIGRPTEGAILGGEEIDLPGGWSVVVPTHAPWDARGESMQDRPITPQIQVPLDRAQLCAGIDSDLRKAFELIDAGAAR
jgi:carboxyl-terminal processing protease